MGERGGDVEVRGHTAPCVHFCHTRFCVGLMCPWIINCSCVSGWGKQSDGKTDPKNHATPGAMLLCVYGRADISTCLTRSSDQSIPRHLQANKTPCHGKRWSGIAPYAHQRQAKKSFPNWRTGCALVSSLLVSSELSQDGVCSSAEMPSEERSFIKIVIPYDFHPRGGCLLGRRCLQGKEGL